MIRALKAVLNFAKSLVAHAEPTPDDIAGPLRKIVANSEDYEAWEDFEAWIIKDPVLAAIQKEALNVPIPADAEGRATFERLLAQASALSTGKTIG